MENQALNHASKFPHHLFANDSYHLNEKGTGVLLRQVKSFLYGDKERPSKLFSSKPGDFPLLPKGEGPSQLAVSSNETSLGTVHLQTDLQQTPSNVMSGQPKGGIQPSSNTLTGHSMPGFQDSPTNDMPGPGLSMSGFEQCSTSAIPAGQASSTLNDYNYQPAGFRNNIPTDAPNVNDALYRYDMRDCINALSSFQRPNSFFLERHPSDTLQHASMDIRPQIYDPLAVSPQQPVPFRRAPHYPINDSAYPPDRLIPQHNMRVPWNNASRDAPMAGPITTAVTQPSSSAYLPHLVRGPPAAGLCSAPMFSGSLFQQHVQDQPSPYLIPWSYDNMNGSPSCHFLGHRP